MALSIVVRQVLCFGGPADGQIALFVAKPGDWFLMRGGVYERVGADVAVFTGHRDPTAPGFDPTKGGARA